MTFPSDPVLIARGKYATLTRERREQVKRLQGTCETAMHAVQQILKGGQESPPNGVQAIDALDRCLTSMKDAHERIKSICEGMDEVRAMAWEDGE